MKIDPKLVDQWEDEWWRLPEKDETGDFEYIAQRAADHALEKAYEIACHCADADMHASMAANAIRAMKGTK